MYVRVCFLKVCNIHVASSGVFFTAENNLGAQERSREARGGQNTYAQLLLWFFGGHLKVKYLSPFLPGPLPCRPLSVCPRLERCCVTKRLWMSARTRSVENINNPSLAAFWASQYVGVNKEFGYSSAYCCRILESCLVILIFLVNEFTIVQWFFQYVHSVHRFINGNSWWLVILIALFHYVP